jgi:hypothetical protein
MKIKFHAAEKFISENSARFIGKKIVSFETEYLIRELVFDEGEMLVGIVMTAMPDSPLKLTMDIERAAELAGIEINWAEQGFKAKKQ